VGRDGLGHGEEVEDAVLWLWNMQFGKVGRIYCEGVCMLFLFGGVSCLEGCHI
jgi:hypothetical protein